MRVIAINGYKSFIGKNFVRKYKKKYKIIHYKKNINNYKNFNLFIKKNNFDFFIHFASLSRHNCEKNKILCQKTNFEAVKKIIKNLNTLKKKPLFIFISSSYVYESSKNKLRENSKVNPTTLYGSLKLRCENYIMNKYKNYCILRLFNIYGKDQPSTFFIPDIIEKIKKKQLIELNKSIRDYIHVNDVIKIIDFVVKNNVNSILNVGSGKSTSLNFLLNKISKKLKIKPILKINKKQDKFVASIQKLRKIGYLNKINEKIFNF